MHDKAKTTDPNTGATKTVDQVALLETSRQAISGWRAAAAGVGVDLRQVNLTFPDGAPVVFEWDVAAQSWLITTTGQPVEP